jgi:signal transduction histidine kinase/ActR/RegA family two-component response regulator
VQGPALSSATPQGVRAWIGTCGLGEKEARRSVRGEGWRAALLGAAREDLVQELIHALAVTGPVDRIGVWLEQDSAGGSDADGAEVLRGLIWEKNEDPTPCEWERLSLQPPVPCDLLASGSSVEQELDAAALVPVFGPLIGLHRVLWAPVRGRSRLRGVLLAGSQKKHAQLPRELAEALAAELALALELEDEQRLSRHRQADLHFSREILAAIAGGDAIDSVLSQIAASCTELFGGSDHGGFAVIGHLSMAPAGSATPADVDVAWKSGDAAWTSAVEREPLLGLWQRALQTEQVFGIEPPALSASGLARLVAIPLGQAEEKLGVLLAGFPRHASSLHTLARLESRATLAVAALAQRKLEAERFRRTARRHALVENSAEATILLDARGAIAGVNLTARILLEEAPESREGSPKGASGPNANDTAWYLGGKLHQIFCAREHSRIEEWLRHALAPDHGGANESPSRVEAELLTGARVRLHAPLPLGDDLVAIVLDPAASHAAALQLSRSEAELQHLLEWVEEGVLLFDASQTIRAMNTRFAQIVGLSAEEASSCGTLEDLVEQLAARAPEPEAFAVRWRELARAAEGASREEVPLARPVPRVLERSLRPVLDSTGRRLGRVEIYRDLTAQRVFQAKLLQTEKLAALGQMITGVAHELSSPLTSILGYSQRLLVRDDLAGRSAEARQIYQEAERASAILRQLLHTARETQPERKRVALNQVVQKAVELQRFGSAAEKISIELDLDPGLPFVLGDAGQLQQVLMNLIGNARQAISGEGRPGAIRLHTSRSGSHRVQLKVSDDGPGIPPAILARIFDPFFTTKPAGEGTGLGLSIVLSVVREHGGQVHVSNLPGGGAAFAVELPVAAEVATRNSAHPSARQEMARPALPSAIGRSSRPHLARPPAARANYRGSRVLVIEDEPTVARLIMDVLEDEGMRVDVLLDGREAMARASRERYDLVICDMRMPGVDGQHFYRSLVEAHSPLQERFLFVTGDVLAAQTQEFLQRNDIPYLAKPFRVEELMEKTSSLLDRQLARAGRAAAGKKGL